MTTCTTQAPSSTTDTTTPTRRYCKPRYQAHEDKDGYHVSVSVPGASKSGVTLSVLNEVLTITATRADAVPDTWKPLTAELPQNDYRLLLQLDGSIDPERISAKLENGVLSVHLPLRASQQPRVIEIH